MGRKSTVDKLPEEQFEFVMKRLANGDTDHEVEIRFAEKFPGHKCPKSSLHSWRKKVGDEFVEHYKITRFLAKSVVEGLADSGIDIGDDRYRNIIEGIEDTMLTKTREIFAQDPMKLLAVRQEDEKLRVKREQIELNREKLVLERQKLLGATTDPVKQGTEFMTELFDYGKDDAEVVLFIKKHTKPFIESLRSKYAEVN
jgi:hypothetical protein